MKGFYLETKVKKVPTQRSLAFITNNLLMIGQRLGSKCVKARQIDKRNDERLKWKDVIHTPQIKQSTH